MRTWRLILSFTMVGAVVACSSEAGLSAEEQEFADAWAATLRDDEDGLSAGADEAVCMGEAIMAELGAPVFEDADVTPDDISRDEDSNSPGELVGGGVIADSQANAILDVWEDDCVDLADLLSESAAEDFSLDDEGQTCFAEGMESDDLARDLLLPSFTSSTDTPDAATLSELLELVDSCGGGGGSAIVSSIADGLSADGSLTEEEAECIAQAMVDAIGLERLIAGALVAAAGSCDVPISAFG